MATRYSPYPKRATRRPSNNTANVLQIVERIYPAQSVNDQHAMQLQAAHLLRQVMQEVIFDLERGTLDHKVLKHTDTSVD